MRWSLVRPAVLSVMGTLSGIETAWRDRERCFVPPGSEALCLLHTSGTSSVVSVGDDDFRQVYNEDTELVDITQAGIRLFTVSVLVESYCQDDDKTALEYLANIQDGLTRPQILATLRSNGMTVLKVSETRDLSHDEDDHMISSAQMDVFFAYANNVTAEDGKPGLEPINWIETVILEDGYTE